MGRHAIVCALMALLPGCITNTDVSGNPDYRGGEIVGKCFRLPNGGFVVHGGAVGSPYWVVAAGQQYPTVEDYINGKTDRGRYPDAIRIRAVIPHGGRIKVERLILRGSIENEDVLPEARVLDWSMHGSQCLVFPTLIELDYGSNGGPFSWIVHREQAEPCD